MRRPAVSTTTVLANRRRRTPLRSGMTVTVARETRPEGPFAWTAPRPVAQSVPGTCTARSSRRASSDQPDAGGAAAGAGQPVAAISTPPRCAAAAEEQGGLVAAHVRGAAHRQLHRDRRADGDVSGSGGDDVRARARARARGRAGDGDRGPRQRREHCECCDQRSSCAHPRRSVHVRLPRPLCRSPTNERGRSCVRAEVRQAAGRPHLDGCPLRACPGVRNRPGLAPVRTRFPRERKSRRSCRIPPRSTGRASRTARSYQGSVICREGIFRVSSATYVSSWRAAFGHAKSHPIHLGRPFAT